MEVHRTVYSDGAPSILSLTMKVDFQNHLIEVETKLAFQEHALQELNAVVIRQQQQIDALVSEVKSLKERLRAVATSPVGALEDEKPPPHY